MDMRRQQSAAKVASNLACSSVAWHARSPRACCQGAACLALQLLRAGRGDQLGDVLKQAQPDVHLQQQTRSARDACSNAQPASAAARHVRPVLLAHLAVAAAAE